MKLSLIKKVFVTLKKDFWIEDSSYAEEKGFYSVGSEGFILDPGTMSLIPNLSEEKLEELIRREISAKKRAHFLLLINEKIVSIPAEYVDENMSVEPSPICESDEKFCEIMRKIENGGA